MKLNRLIFALAALLTILAATATAVDLDLVRFATAKQSQVREFAQTLTKQAWGGTDLQVRDPDGNVISFVTYG